MPSADSRESGSQVSDLQFPLLQSSYDLSQLIAHSNTTEQSSPQRSSTNMAPRASIPLGESSYDIVSEAESSVHGDEIEVDTDDTFGSAASVNGHASDDVESLSGTEMSGESQIFPSESEPEELPAFAGLDAGFSDSNSGMTVTNHGRSPSSSIEFTEEELSGTDYVAVTHTIRNFSEAEASKILNSRSGDTVPNRLTATLRQTMARGGVAVDGSFRVLYVGNNVGKHDIIPKLGSALAAPISGLQEGKVHYSSSRFSVVPISEFGSKRSPHVELIDSFGIELVVDDCTAAKTIRVRNSSDTLMLQLNSSIWISSHPAEHGHDFKIQPDDLWDMPELAVFYIAENESTEDQKLRHYAKAFLARHHVPSLNICETPLYDLRKESMVLNPDSIHVCLESRHGSQSVSKVHKRTPVDLATFLSLDSRQMNRNFAFLTRSTAKGARTTRLSTPEVKNASKHALSYSNLKQTCRSYYSSQTPERRASFLACCLSLLLVLLAFSGAYFEPAICRLSWNGDCASQNAVSGSNMSPSIAPERITPMTKHTERISQKGPKSTALVKQSDTRALTGPIADIANMLLDSGSAVVNHSDKFDLHLIGDTHMILKSPHRFSQLKKPPKIFVRALRDDVPVQTKLSKLFDGVWTVQLEREEAYGLINVSVWTKTKPVLREDFEMDFGTPWLKLISWQKSAAKLSTAIQKDLQYANGKLLTAIGEVATGPQGLFVQVSKQAKIARHKLKQTSLIPVNHTKALVSFGASRLKKRLQKGDKFLKGEVALYAGDLAATVSRRTAQTYRTVRSFPAGQIWQNLHPVRPSNVWSEASRHVRMIRNGQAYTGIMENVKCMKGKKCKKIGRRMGRKLRN